jgi:hypothetical protein
VQAGAPDGALRRHYGLNNPRPFWERGDHASGG